MNPLLEQLHDIEGLDSISFWPLAIGWWVVIIFTILALCTLIWFIASTIAFKRSWKNEIFQTLARMEKNLSDDTARETIVALSEYLRRIALQRFSRKECAGLAGDAWLKWLKAKDPKNYDWEKKGILLIEMPYAPKKHVPPNQIKDLIQAVKNWVR